MSERESRDAVTEAEVDKLAILAGKAAAFDALADRLPSGAWRVDPWEPLAFINGVRITVAATGERFSAERLADAVRMALEAEGDLK